MKQKLNGKYKLRWGRSLMTIIALLIVTNLIYAQKRNSKKRDFRFDLEKSYLESIPQVGKDAPNIIIIYADDMGYGDISAFGSEAVKTPEIDALAEKGVRLTNYYAPSNVCSPSRAGLLTGRYPVRAHVPNVFLRCDDFKYRTANRIMHIANVYSYGMETIAQDEVMLQKVLGAGGYSTALIGKWHLGEREGERPNDNGFDYFYGAHYSNDMTPYRIYENSEVAIEAPADQTVLTKDLTQKSIRFIEENKDKPFFLYYASPFPHNPPNASDDWIGKSDGGLFGDCVQELDWSVGEIMKTLKKHGLDNNTIVIFTSDNGPWFEGSSGPNRGRKGNIHNGGFKVPFIAWMPGVILEGAILNHTVSGMDLYPTLLNLVGIELTKDRKIDGVNALSYFKGEDTEFNRGELVLFQGKTPEAIIDGNYKYFRENKSENSTYKMIKVGPFMYDLSKDVDESYDVSMKYPEKAEELKNRLNSFENEINNNLRGWNK
ncbi:sulfatase family protein [Maribellus mangrovi]|uniref:sulfatase family protein n=1 Tax=Maribellus mangrovi TaxID=3133146 RepID=UPI0030EEE1A4